MANQTFRRRGGPPPYKEIGKYTITIKSVSVSDKPAALGEGEAFEGIVDPQIIICDGNDDGYWAMAETEHASGSRRVDFRGRSFELYYLTESSLYLVVVDVDDASGEVLDVVALPKRSFSGTLPCRNGSQVEVAVTSDLF